MQHPFRPRHPTPDLRFMPTSLLLRTLHFRASHRYGLEAWSEEENRRHFGELVEPHAHDFEVEVVVAGTPDPATGFVVDLGALDRLLAREISAPLAGTLLNESVPPFRGGETQPSCEALAGWIGERLRTHLPAGVRLDRVRVREDATLAGEVRWSDEEGGGG